MNQFNRRHLDYLSELPSKAVYYAVRDLLADMDELGEEQGRELLEDLTLFDPETLNIEIENLRKKYLKP